MVRKENPKYWSFVVFAQKTPLMYYPYKFKTKWCCKEVAKIMVDILQGDRICIYDSRHYPDLFTDMPLNPKSISNPQYVRYF